MNRFIATSLALLLLACTEYGYTSRTQVDVFRQSRRNMVDVLLVVDNSGSMWEEQDKLATNFQSFIKYFREAEVDWALGVITTDTHFEDQRGRLQGGDDEIILVNPSGTTVDRVAWDRSWGVATGAAHQLDPSVTTATGNDASSAWCSATDVYGESDKGTPGAPNRSCAEETRGTPEPPDDPDTGDPDTGDPDTGDPDTGDPDPGEPLPAPRVGEVLITEFMADPSDMPDELGEWVELTSMVDWDVSLAGCELQDDGRNAFAFPDGVVLPARGVLVAARSDEAGAGATVITGDAFTMNNNELIIGPDTDAVEEVFAEMVSVGITGSGMEMGLEAARMALSEPTYSEYNESFLRDDASLSVIIVSDEDDSSPLSVDEYVSYLVGLKGEEAFRDHGLMNISAVVGKDRPEFNGAPSCSSAHGMAWYGSRYIKAADYTQGLVESICEEDFSPIAENLGLTISGMELEFALSAACEENSLEVSLYETDDLDSLVRVLERDIDYTYVVERNAIRFVEDQVPPPEWYIIAEYKLQAVGAASSSGGGE